jgi:excisionase family DNA binding protein
MLFTIVGVVTTKAAAARLGVSKPTVRSLIDRGHLRARQEVRGSRFRWLIEESELERFLGNKTRVGRAKRPRSRLAQLESDLASLRDLVNRVAANHLESEENPDVERERDDLRAEVVRLQDALTRSQIVVELQAQADQERSDMVEHLIAAIAAGERADGLRRRAAAEYEETIAAFSRPGHPGQMQS